MQIISDTTRDVAEILERIKITRVKTHLKALGRVSELNIWTVYQLKKSSSD